MLVSNLTTTLVILTQGQATFKAEQLQHLYFKEKLDTLPPSKILLAAEGEGRNAVYAASQGWEVYCFDNNMDIKRL